MTEPRIPFGRSANDGRMISVDAVMRGLACECECAQCARPLVACKGDVRRHYFRHHTDMECREARETAIHLYAKQAICETLTCALPDYDLGRMRRAAPEATLENIRTDVLADYSVEPVAIEIFVTHQVPREKIATFDRLKHAAIEIDMRPFRHADLGEEQWKSAVLAVADRVWLYPPRAIREAAERARQEKIAAAIARERELEAIRAKIIAERRELEGIEAIRESYRNQQATEASHERITRERELAEAYLKDADRRAALSAWRKRATTPPDLGKLVAAHGGFDRITPEAWAEFEEESAVFRQRIREGFRYARF